MKGRQQETGQIATIRQLHELTQVYRQLLGQQMQWVSQQHQLIAAQHVLLHRVHIRLGARFSELGALATRWLVANRVPPGRSSVIAPKLICTLLHQLLRK